VEGQIVCSYIGTIGMACGLEVMLRAGEILPARGRGDVMLLAIGDGAVRARLAEESEARGLANVRFLGRRPKEEIRRYLALSDICLVHLRKTPLFTTVMPSKIFEAAGMRRPILNGVNGDARELVERAECGLCFEPENAEEMADRLCELADDSAERKRLGDNGYRYVCDHFDRDVLAGRYLGYLETMRAGG
jgi:glycosyltransferase involved in cell wall biosynthesis